MFKDMDGVLQKCNDSITDDNRMGSDPLIMLLQEKHHTTDETDIKNLYENPQVWRYRARLTVDHLSQMLNSREETCKMLQLFLKDEHHLRVLRLIPNVIRLQKMLTKTFGRKLDRTEGAVLTIDKIKQQMDHGGTLNEFKEYLDSYTEAWEAVRQSLETYSCCANGGILRVGKSHCRKPIDDKTPVCYLLPTYKDTGLCAYLTLRFLLEKQNAFLDDYCRHKQIPYRSLPRVHVKDISVAHLISFHPDKDLLPMILANCNYSFEVGHGTKIDYNFVNLERQLMDRFLFSKSVIIGLNEIDVFTYRAENTNGAVLDALSKRIVQEKIPHVLQGQIELELRKIPFSDLCESLDILDVAISFLKSVGTEKPQTLLYNFMTKVLKMEKSFPSQKAQQSIMCCHAMSWWMKLALERATSLMKYNQEPFEGIADNFTKPLTEKQKSFLEKTFSALPLDAISSLVELMFEFIVLKIDIQIDLEDDSYCNISDKSLCDYLKEFPDSLPYNESSVVDISLLKVIDSLTTDQNEDNQITIGHSVNFWTFINNMLITKHHQRN
ncbi:Hypothetical predicted protein [Mytilus galloprovincialis]|uniref:Uncharacterized protein n=2 Tax=Mytilus galloprovincialis TaxID=29158 RepID=A0A8B6HLS7_MYTGA|nr:Hypothetical predicted protein [Mytilus galloprovincialis]